MTEQEYYRIAHACDRVLCRPDASLEWVAIPWLHVICQHPLIVANYRRLVEDLDAGDGRRGGVRRLGRVFGRTRETTYLVVAAARNLLRAVAYHRQPLPRLNHADVIIVSWLVNADHLEMTHDFYFGDLQSRLARRGLSSLLVLRNQTAHSTRSLVECAQWDGPCARMLLPDVLGTSHEARLVRRCFTARRELRRAERDAVSFLDRHVVREARRQAVSIPTIANLRLHAQIADLCRRMRPSVVLTLHEGHAWERCVWHAARTSLPSVLCVGYQHTILWQHSHAIKRSLGPITSVNPDLVLTVGHVSRRILEASPELRGVRVLTYGTHRRSSDGRPDDGPRFVPAVLVLPEGHESECIYLFDFALACARGLPDARFIFRTHSILPFEKVEPKLKGYHPVPANVEVSRGRSIDDDFGRAGYVLYRGSSTAIHAILAGLKPFYVARSGELSIDPLYEVSEWRERVSSVDDFVAKYTAHRARGRGDGLEEWKRVREFCDAYMQPIHEDIVDEMLEQAAKAAVTGAEGIRVRRPS